MSEFDFSMQSIDLISHATIRSFNFVDEERAYLNFVECLRLNKLRILKVMDQQTLLLTFEIWRIVRPNKWICPAFDTFLTWKGKERKYHNDSHNANDVKSYFTEFEDK